MRTSNPKGRKYFKHSFQSQVSAHHIESTSLRYLNVTFLFEWDHEWRFNFFPSWGFLMKTIWTNNNEMWWTLKGFWWQKRLKFNCMQKLLCLKFSSQQLFFMLSLFVIYEVNVTSKGWDRWRGFLRRLGSWSKRWNSPLINLNWCC